jgi:hypothetical protein
MRFNCAASIQRFTGVVDPHRVDPQQARILDERRYYRRDLDRTLPIGVADVDVTRSVDRSAARGRRVGEVLDMVGSFDIRDRPSSSQRVSMR